MHWTHRGHRAHDASYTVEQGCNRGGFMAETTAQTPSDGLAGLIDLPKLNDWLASHNAPGSGPVTSAKKLAGGLQNNVFLIERGKDSFVLRRPSKHVRQGSNETMLKEARVLKALAGSAVPHPEFYAVCD